MINKCLRNCNYNFTYATAKIQFLFPYTVPQNGHQISWPGWGGKVTRIVENTKQDGGSKVLTKIVENMKQQWDGASGFLGCLMVVTKIHLTKFALPKIWLAKILADALVANELANIR